jgi:hypothetical protein
MQSCPAQRGTQVPKGAAAVCCGRFWHTIGNLRGQEPVVIDKQLEEQLERIRSLNEQLSAMYRGVTENRRLIELDRGTRSGPLNEVRDYRTHQSPDYEDFPAPPRTGLRRPAEVADTARRRRRR